MCPLRLVDLKGIPILEQLRLEEALLRADSRNWCLINHGSSPAIVMGISGKFDLLVDRNKLQLNPIPVIRRFSGGGTVVVDRRTIFSTFIFNADALPILPFPQHIMRQTEAIYRPLFEGLPFQLRENDYVLGEKKIGGNAQSITKSRWLHHSSFLFDINPVLMDLLLMPAKAPEYRRRRNHNDFLDKLCRYWPHAEEFKANLIQCLEKQFKISFGTVEELARISELPHRKTTRIEQ